MNLKLKAASTAKDRFHYVTARNLNIRAEVFSGLISGRIVASEDLIRKLEQYFQKKRTALGFK